MRSSEPRALGRWAAYGLPDGPQRAYDPINVIRLVVDQSPLP